MIIITHNLFIPQTTPNLPNSPLSLTTLLHTAKIYSMDPAHTCMLEKIHLWNDTIPRSGELNMAIDQLLLETIQEFPILRFYQWSSPSVSLGYFESLATAKANFPEDNLQFIRRWTGGGIVDHRIDITYTLAIPRNHPWARLPGAESYRIIHLAVAKALNQLGAKCNLTTQNEGDGASTCFTNPVTHDIITPTGEKLAGAGQKRTRYGLLHQGSVICNSDKAQWRNALVQSIAESSILLSPDTKFLELANQLTHSRYSTAEWLNKRH